MSDPDRLAEIKARWANEPEALDVSKAWALVDVRWLVGEVEGLRVELADALRTWHTEVADLRAALQACTEVAAAEAEEAARLRDELAAVLHPERETTPEP